MKKKISQKELAELRKREQVRKEFECELDRDLKLRARLDQAEESRFANKNRFIIAAINFFGTLTILWIPYSIANMIFPLGSISNVIKAIILTISIISAFRKRSLIEEWF